jgi:hypothetical protein
MTFHWIGGPNNGGTSRALFLTWAQSTKWGLGAFLRSRSDDEGSEDVSEMSALMQWEPRDGIPKQDPAHRDRWPANARDVVDGAMAHQRRSHDASASLGQMGL